MSERLCFTKLPEFIVMEYEDYPDLLTSFFNTFKEETTVIRDRSTGGLHNNETLVLEMRETNEAVIAVLNHWINVFDQKRALFSSVNVFCASVVICGDGYYEYGNVYPTGLSEDNGMITVTFNHVKTNSPDISYERNTLFRKFQDLRNSGESKMFDKHSNDEIARYILNTVEIFRHEYSTASTFYSKVNSVLQLNVKQNILHELAWHAWLELLFDLDLIDTAVPSIWPFGVIINEDVVIELEGMINKS